MSSKRGSLIGMVALSSDGVPFESSSASKGSSFWMVNQFTENEIPVGCIPLSSVSDNESTSVEKMIFPMSSYIVSGAYTETGRLPIGGLKESNLLGSHSDSAVITS